MFWRQIEALCPTDNTVERGSAHRLPVCSGTESTGRQTPHPFGPSGSRGNGHDILTMWTAAATRTPCLVESKKNGRTYENTSKVCRNAPRPAERTFTLPSGKSLSGCTISPETAGADVGVGEDVAVDVGSGVGGSIAPPTIRSANPITPTPKALPRDPCAKRTRLIRPSADHPMIAKAADRLPLSVP